MGKTNEVKQLPLLGASAAEVGAGRTVDPQLASARMHQQIGVSQGAAATAKVATLVARAQEIAWLASVRESKGYKGTWHGSDGLMHRCNSWDDFCKCVVGRDRRQVDREIESVQELGPELHEALSSLGLSSRKLRLLGREASDADLQQIQQIAARGDAEQLASAVESIVTRERLAADERNEHLQREVERQRSELDAKDRRLAKSAERSHSLQQELDELRTPPPSTEGQQRDEVEEVKDGAVTAFAKAKALAQRMWEIGFASPVVQVELEQLLEVLEEGVRDLRLHPAFGADKRHSPAVSGRSA